MDLIGCIENETGCKATLNMMDMQPGDVYATYANTDKLASATGFKPYTSLQDGISRFVRWYREYYDLGNTP